MNVFAKIFSQIFDSSISSDYMVRHVFMDLLVLADRDGVVDMTLDAISRRTNVPEEIVAKAISELMREDRSSRSHEEEGRRLIPIDSHRDWGWQIVNYEHYRNIRDEEARRTYFRDKKRQQRAKMSTLVKDCPIASSIVTQGEGEGEGEVDTDTKDNGKLDGPPDSGSELMLAQWIFEEANVPCDNSLVRVAADCIRKLAKEGGTAQTAAEYILSAAKAGRASGDTINRFWFTDQKYLPQKPKKTERQKRIDEWEPSE